MDGKAYVVPTAARSPHAHALGEFDGDVDALVQELAVRIGHCWQSSLSRLPTQEQARVTLAVSG